MCHLLVFVYDLKVHVETVCHRSDSFKTEFSLSFTWHGHFEVGLMLRATTRLCYEIASIIEDFHVGSAHIRIVVVREHQLISILLRFEA
jgi:hypothetical protein